ncbi:hypothetical protein FP435_01440 [Lactobacillus sp. PV037]|uniref:hypothetical protein n=1 Tax=unclassified Lactobacillus TaxID=2620435 RepID=UPI00223F4B78|nr:MULTISPECIES: hypothetical protein [unclassified Lactobacillus]QNQ82692.1 hypothetical protein FP433_06370 [Lactobacillus sp. PV012]QNQ83189.1 hypothetical protein FP435_01440 [Lactobacillus sp. PV037]
MKKNLLVITASIALLGAGSIMANNTTQVSAKTTKAERMSQIPSVNYISHTKKGITYKLQVAKKAKVVFSYNGKTILSKKAKSSHLKVFISAKKLKGKKGAFSVRQIQPGKKASKTVKAKIIKIGLVEEKII